MISSSRSIWNIGLSAWIIQDGNYPDFAVGDTVELAVEFYLRPGTAVDVCESEVCARPVAENRYAVVAEKVLAAEDVTVLDLGILAYHDGPLQLPETKRGGRLRTALDLTVDRYFYFERLSQDAGVPALIYTWRISSILRQTAPFIETIADSGPYAGERTKSRDASNLAYEEITKTDSWGDDGGYGEYVLRCDLLPAVAKRTSFTAT
ncbi:MAG TPA: hypothetical protein VMQ86_00520 [Bryobacteraceae bacterium]|jgi:hypothetical protein|nr:hypothetical protein [Bryobacteraceae bacterium]